MSDVPAQQRARFSIGEVLTQLRGDFPAVSISKIRFLEAEGLVEPERTPSGYRKFSAAQVERLRYILTAQRDHYLPLKVIREHLDALERGLEPGETPGEPPRAPRGTTTTDAPPDPEAPALRLSRRELLRGSGLTEQQLAELEGYGLVTTVVGTSHYDGDALAAATAAATMASFGLEPRHLRAFKTAADRQATLIEQVLSPRARRRDAAETAKVAENAEALTAVSLRLHAALLSASLRRRP